MIISRTPFRISLFGGGTDYPSWYDINGGKVINFSIDKFCYISIRHLPPYFNYRYRMRYYKHEEVKNIKDIKHPTIRETLKYFNFKNKGLEIIHNADVPALSGLGSSSTFTVGLINVLNRLHNKRLTKKKIAELAIKIEQEYVRDFVGSQDQVIASYGGLNAIRFKKNFFRVNPIKINDCIKNTFNKNLILVFTGLQRKANSITKKLVSKNYKNQNFDYLNKISNLTNIVEREIFKSKNFDINNFSEALNYQWHLKKNLDKSISNNKIDELYEFAMKNGAEAGKLLGAGGGGFLLFLVKDQNLKKFKNSIGKKLVIPFSIEKKGSQIIYSN